MANTTLPIVRPASVVPAGVTISFIAVGRMGRVSMINRGPNTAFARFDGTPPSAAIQDNVISLNVGDAFNVGNTFFTTIGLLVAAAESAVVEIVAFQSSGAQGEGSGFL